MSTERAHLSIGEVLGLLQEEFPDVTISKIRFLESQGLLDPERTPSGYRKFYDGDIDRLRWILRQQRENFLPLKVIKDRLAESERTGRPLESFGGRETGATEVLPPALDPDQPAPEPASTAPATPLDTGPTSVSLTRDELCSAAGLTEKALTDLERFGMVAGRPAGRETFYGDDALVVATLAAGFLRYGVEARHLRMYKVAAEREAGFFEQVVMPLLKQRNPESRRRAGDAVHDLASLGEGLRGAMLRQALRDATGPL
jgi:DNA-binding transcriptional MerR regulator